MVRTKIIALQTDKKTAYMFLHRSDDVYFTVQLPDPEEIRFPFDLEDLGSELRFTAGGLWHRFFQIENMNILGGNLNESNEVIG